MSAKVAVTLQVVHDLIRKEKPVGADRRASFISPQSRFNRNKNRIGSDYENRSAGKEL